MSLVPDMIDLQAAGLRSQVAAHPVSRQAYRTYLRAAGLPAPAALTRPGEPSSAVVYVSQAGAGDYCRWLAGQEGQPFRLPTMAELLALYSETDGEGASPEIWPQGDIAGVEPGQAIHEPYYCEWTGETEVVPQFGVRPDRVFGLIFYPPWLRQGANATHLRAAVDPKQGYSFVCFRVARSL